tara:strand:+ start:337 stop:531 length:195 start_codon:yes stop_codon:yes gene_type:complete
MSNKKPINITSELKSIIYSKILKNNFFWVFVSLDVEKNKSRTMGNINFENAIKIERGKLLASVN